MYARQARTRWLLGLAITLTAAGGCGSGAAGENEAAGFEEVRSSLPYDSTPDIPPADYETFIGSTNDFGLTLLQKLAPADGNFFYSPASTAMALGMVYAGARGDTAVEMAAAFKSTLPQEVFAAGMNHLMLDLASRNIAPRATNQGTKELTLLPANAAWLQRGLTLQPDYLDTLSTQYDAGVKLIDFSASRAAAKTINRWVADRTKDKILDLIPEQALSADVPLVLTNALYFYGSWAVPFQESATEPGVFHTHAGADVTVPMLHDTRAVPYAEGDGYQMIDLAYEGGKLSMTVLMPAAGRFVEIRDGITPSWLEQARAGMTADGTTRLTLPKFRFTWGTSSLTDALKAMGMVHAFTGGADFSGVFPGGGIFISDVLHQAFVAVDEFGTEAAAATAVIFRGVSGAILKHEMLVDRPFLVFIRDANGTLLFAGQVTDPAAS